MNKMIEIVYELRSIYDKLERDRSLTMEEFSSLAALEAELERPEVGREFHRISLRVAAKLKRKEEESVVVQITDLSPGGLRLIGCPTLSTGDEITIHFRAENAKTYCFPAKVTWVREHSEEHMAGIRFVGQPLQSKPENSNELREEFRVAQAAQA